MIYTVTFNPAIDYVVRLDAPLEVGEVNRAKGEDCVLGGKGINVSGVLAQLGCESVALGFVAGETGAWLERGLAAQGLKTDFVHLEQGMTRINVKIKAGQETELNGAGTDIPESAMQELEKKLDSLNEDDILILAGSIPASLSQATYERLLAQLQGRGVRAVVDATQNLLLKVLPYEPFSSVSCPALILTLMRVIPSCRWMKSVCRPWAARPRSSQAPVSPAIKPRATLSTPSWASTPDTLMPLPPSTQSSPVARLMAATCSGLSSRTT